MSQLIVVFVDPRIHIALQFVEGRVELFADHCLIKLILCSEILLFEQWDNLLRDDSYYPGWDQKLAQQLLSNKDYGQLLFAP
jgi:hypothetical protein